MAAISNKVWALLAAIAAAALFFAGVQIAPSVSGARQQQAVAVPASATSVLTPTAQPSLAVARPVASTAVPDSTPSLPNTAAVRRGSIDQTLQLDGRVSGAQEIPLSFSQKSVTAKVDVQVGQTVAAGQTLVESDSTQVSQALDAARDQAETAQIRLDGLKQTTGQASASPNSPANTTTLQGAQDALSQAQANLATVQAGSTDVDKQTADAQVASASAQVQKLQADLAHLQGGPAPDALRQAQQQLATSQFTLREVQAAAEVARQGPTAPDVRTAERAVADAQTALTTAQADLDRLVRGPDPFQVRDADRNVQRAQDALNAANAMSTSGPNASASASARDAAIASARLGLADAQDRLAKLRQPPDPDVVATAKNKVDGAKATVASAQEKLDVLRSGPDQAAIDKANAAVQTAQSSVQDTQDKLNALQTPPSDDQVQTAQAAVQSAQAALASAQAKRDDVYSHPTPAELQDAQHKVDAAQAALDGVRKSLQAPAGPNTTQILAERDVAKAQDRVAQLEQQLSETQLRAPSAGSVVAIPVQQGDSIDAGKPVVVLAAAGDPVIRATLANPPDQGAARPATPQVAPGQKAVVVLDGGDGEELGGSVVSVDNSGGQASRTAVIQLDWGATAPTYGTTAQVRITLQQKRDVLLVPVAAVHKSSSNTQYVQYLAGTTPQIATVQVGSSNDKDVEIVSGLSEGQLVVLDGPVQASAAATPVAPGAAGDRPGLDQPGSNGSEILLDENFADNDRQWPTNPRGAAWWSGGIYNMLSATDQFVAVGAPLSQPLADVTVTATFRKVGGPAGGGYGIIVRDQDPSSHDGTNQSGDFYAVEAGDEGTVGIWRRAGGEWVDIVPWTKSDVVRAGTEENTLSVEAAGDQLIFTVNGTEVTRASDAKLAKGGVGVFVGGDADAVALTHFLVETPVGQ
jgi:multidrug efflux pump subunit AcrA (membrane-fusion protein)